MIFIKDSKHRLSVSHEKKTTNDFLIAQLKSLLKLQIEFNKQKKMKLCPNGKWGLILTEQAGSRRITYWGNYWTKSKEFSQIFWAAIYYLWCFPRVFWWNQFMEQQQMNLSSIEFEVLSVSTLNIISILAHFFPCNSESLKVLKDNTLQPILPSPNSVFTAIILAELNWCQELTCVWAI